MVGEARRFVKARVGQQESCVDAGRAWWYNIGTVEALVPIISTFFGIKILMYWDEHQPPHFHAVYGEHSVLIDIHSGTALKGIVPFKQLKLVLAWCEIHREELLMNWDTDRRHGQLVQIEALR